MVVVTVVEEEGKVLQVNSSSAASVRRQLIIISVYKKIVACWRRFFAAQLHVRWHNKLLISSRSSTGFKRPKEKVVILFP